MSRGMWSMLGGLLSAAVPAKGAGSVGSLEKRTANVGGEDYDYQVYVPGKVRGVADSPVIVFLHGIGQRGTGGFLPESGAAGAVVRHYLEQVPALILLPQCRPDRYWSDPIMGEMVMASLGQAVEEFGASTRRLYLTGVSMGGYGVWHLASHHPGSFAALVSICGGSPLRTGDRFTPVAREVGRTPAWVFHGAEDGVVPVTESRQIVAALRAEGADVRYSEYENAGHNVWLKVMGERDLMPWLLSQRLG